VRVILIVGLGRLFVFRRRLLALLLLFLHFLLLALLHFLLLLIVFVLHLLELLLLPLLRLLLALLVLLLLDLLVLLNLFLFELLALLILLLAKLVELLLLTLLDLRIHGRARSGRPIVEVAIIVGAIIWLRLRLIGLSVWMVVIRLRLRRRLILLPRSVVIRLHLHRRLILLRRPVVIRQHLSRLLILLRRTIVVLLGLRWLVLLGRAIIVRLGLGLVRLARAIVHALALRRQLSRPCILHDANVVAGNVVLAILGSRHGAAAIGLHLLQLAINRLGRGRRGGLGDNLASHEVSRRPHASLLR